MFPVRRAIFENCNKVHSEEESIVLASGSDVRRKVRPDVCELHSQFLFLCNLQRKIDTKLQIVQLLFSPVIRIQGFQTYDYPLPFQTCTRTFVLVCCDGP